MDNTSARLASEPHAGTGSDLVAELAIPTLVLFALIAFTPVVNYEGWTPKAAVALLILGLGLPVLLRRAQLRDGAAIAGLLLVGVAALSAALSVNHTIAVFGVYGWGTGALFVAALPSAWALGSMATSTVAAKRIRLALVAGSTVNACVALLQALIDLSWARLPLIDGRATGLMGGSVSLTAVLTAGVLLAAARYESGVRQLWMPLLLGSALQLSGSRLALLVAVVGSLVALWGRKKHLAVFLAVLIGGFAVGSSISDVRSTTTGVARLQVNDTSGISARPENWRMGLEAFASRPVLGSGPGTYAAATASRRTPALARAEGPDRIFADAHNIAVEHLVTTGLMGATALAAFTVAALRRARAGPLLWFAGGLAASHLYQPQHVSLTPLLFLLVGVAGATGLRPLDLRRRWLIPGLIASGAMAGALLYGDFLLRQSDLDFTQDQASRAMAVLPRWKEPASLQARNVLYEAIIERSRERFETSRAWRLEAARREPTDPTVWGKLADMDVRLAQPDAAIGHFEEGLRRNPVSVSLRLGLAEVLLQTGDSHRARSLAETALQLNPGPKERRALTDILDLLRQTSDASMGGP